MEDETESKEPETVTTSEEPSEHVTKETEGQTNPESPKEEKKEDANSTGEKAEVEQRREQNEERAENPQPVEPSGGTDSSATTSSDSQLPEQSARKTWGFRPSARRYRKPQA